MNRIITLRDLRKKSPEFYYEQGRLFEEYVKNLFNQDSFKIKKWRMSEKLPDGTYIADYSNPDLDLIFAGKKDYRFAVECKWRKQFKKGKINWATEKQIIAYKKFQSKEAITVFIAIGVGGTASNPEKLFVTPLCNLENIPEVGEDQLIKYKRKPTQRFFYNTVLPGLF